MVFRFRIISDKVENFVLYIDADSESTFFELHEAIQFACKFDSFELSTFFLADEEWDRGLEIRMFKDRRTVEPAAPLMKNTRLRDFLKEKEDKLVYLYDIISQKSLYIELNELIMENKLNMPIVNFSKGSTSAQSSSTRYNADLLADLDSEIQHVFTDFGELEDLNLIYGEIGEVM